MMILTAAALMSNLAVAQTTTTTATTVLASADAANQAANSSIANNSDEFSAMRIGYEGILSGPRIDFADGKQKAGDSDTDPQISNRFKLKYVINDNMDAGLQARILTTLKNSGVTGETENFRLFSNIKNLLQSDVGSLTLTPRIVLPTSVSAHNGGRLPSPEIIAQYSVEPKNSRFAFNFGAQFINYYYSSDAVRSTKQVKLDSVGIFEGTYQMSPKTKITAAYYPEMVKFADRAYTTVSNEVDLGVAIDLSKTWTLNPYFATELNYLSDAKKSALLESTGLMVTLTGAIL